METSLSRADLTSYITAQLNFNFPDINPVSTSKIAGSVSGALEKLDNCLSIAKMGRYKRNGVPYFDHLFSDSYMLFLCYLSNSVWQNTQDRDLAGKVYYLNKTMHSFDCMYDNNIPEYFFIVHGLGTIMGKADYGNYFVIYQGCTVGASHGIYPRIGPGVSVTANASVIGNCSIGARSVISTRTTIFQKDIPEDSTAFMDFESGLLKVKSSSRECYAQQFFNADLSKL